MSNQKNKSAENIFAKNSSFYSGLRFLRASRIAVARNLISDVEGPSPGPSFRENESDIQRCSAASPPRAKRLSGSAPRIPNTSGLSIRPSASAMATNSTSKDSQSHFGVFVVLLFLAEEGTCERNRLNFATSRRSSSKKLTPIIRHRIGRGSFA